MTYLGYINAYVLVCVSERCICICIKRRGLPLWRRLPVVCTILWFRYNGFHPWCVRIVCSSIVCRGGDSFESHPGWRVHWKVVANVFSVKNVWNLLKLSKLLPITSCDLTMSCHFFFFWNGWVCAPQTVMMLGYAALAAFPVQISWNMSLVKYTASRPNQSQTKKEFRCLHFNPAKNHPAPKIGSEKEPGLPDKWFCSNNGVRNQTHSAPSQASPLSPQK